MRIEVFGKGVEWIFELGDIFATFGAGYTLRNDTFYIHGPNQGSPAFPSEIKDDGVIANGRQYHMQCQVQSRGKVN